MSWKSKRIARHAAGVALCSLVAFAVWTIATGVAWSPIIIRGDEGPTPWEALSTYVHLCTYLSEAMTFPFLWIPARSILDGPQALVLMALFWGTLLYLLWHLARRCSGKIG